jgi:hypothetical protein
MLFALPAVNDGQRAGAAPVLPCGAERFLIRSIILGTFTIKRPRVSSASHAKVILAQKR